MQMLKRHIGTVILIALALGSSPLAVAVVNPVTGQLSRNFLDVESPDQLYSLRRNYHSARETYGWFGLGMCTVFESKVVMVKKKAYFQYCGAGGKASLDGSRGLVLTKDGQWLNVVGRVYTYAFDLKTRKLSRIYQDQKLVYTIKYDKDQVKVQGKNFGLVLLFKNKLVEEVRYSGKALNYEYDQKRRLAKVSNNDSVLHRYSWKSDKLSGFKSSGGVSERYTYTKVGEVKQVKGNRCVEVAKRSSIKNTRKVSVVRKCKNEQPESYEFSISGRDRYFNYNLTKKGIGIDKAYSYRGGRVDKMRNGATWFGFDYDRLGRLAQLNVDDIVFRVEDRDRFHVKTVGVYSPKVPDKRVMSIKLKWLAGRLLSYNVGGREYEYEETKVGFKVKSRQYSLSVVQRGTKVFLGGIWRGEKLKPFRVDRGPASLSIPEQRILSEVIEQERMRITLGTL